MKSRLAALGAGGVEARTFHSAALGQLHRYAPGSVGRILPTKALLLRQIANALPPPYKFRPAGDLATEIERAKARRVAPDAYLASLDGHEPPIPANLMSHGLPRVRAEEVRSRRDRLRGRARAGGPPARDRRAGAGRPARALSRVHGRRVPGREPAPADAARPVARARATTSASSATTTSRSTPSPAPRREWLLGVAGRFPGAAVVRLEENYRSTPQVLELANRLVPSLGGAEKVLRATRADGPEPVLRPFVSAEAEDAWLAGELRGLEAAGVPFEETAILCRTNARLADFEEVLHEAGVPFQGSSLLGRDAARRLLRQLEREGSAGVARRVRELALEAGWLEVLPDKLGERELTRQADLGRLVKLAEELDDGGHDRRRVRGGAAPALRPRRRRRARRAPAHVPPREGARVRGGVPAEARGQGAAVAPGAHGGGAGRGAAAALRRHHAGEAAAGGDVVAASEPVPGRARRCGLTRSRRSARRACAPERVTRGRGAQALAARARAGRRACRRT